MGPRSRAIHETNFEVYTVDDDGRILETLATANHFDVAKAAFRAALGIRSNSLIRLRNGARVMYEARTGSKDHESRTIAVLWEKP